MPSEAMAKLLSRYPPEVRSLALRARTFVLQLLPKARETVDGTAPVAGYGYGSGYSDIICTLIVSKSGVKLGLVGGASLPDPKGLLEGKGRTHRYLELREPSDLSRAGVRKLVLLAREAWLNRSKGRRRARR